MNLKDKPFNIIWKDDPKELFYIYDKVPETLESSGRWKATWNSERNYDPVLDGGIMRWAKAYSTIFL